MAREIIIYGRVDGNRNVLTESIEIRKDASVIGDQTTRRIIIEDGSAFKGSIEIEKTENQVDSNLDRSVARTVSTSA